MEVDIFGEEMVLFPQKAVYWKRLETLLLADLHLGKINHFRRSGIPVPSKANDRNVELLIEVISKARPRRIICLGDLFHSHYNMEWEVFGELVKHFAPITFDLVLGNHDIMSRRQYERKGLGVFETLTIGRFLLTHHPLEEVPEDCYNLSGHLHPGVRLAGMGKQFVTLPCFFFGRRQAYLPAFGMFTGIARIRPRKDDRVFVVADDQIMLVE